MTDFKCPCCNEVFDDMDFEEVGDCDNIRHEGVCIKCEDDDDDIC